MDPLIATLGEAIFKLLLGGVATFLILLVLVQRGRGGGLAGALGGMGGSSAFGAKSGDVFTKITVVAAAFWILLCIAAVKFAAPTSGDLVNVQSSSKSSAPAMRSASPAEDEKEDSTSSEGASIEKAAGDETSAPATEGEPPAEDKKDE